MFSSIVSLFPSALNIGNNDAPRAPRFSQDDPVSEDEFDGSRESRPSQPLDLPQAATKPREKAVSESFIIVRPPPSKSNHPLNLQVQLVPPNTKPPNGVVSQSNASVQSNQTESDHTLARTSSGRSVSSYSNYGSSTASFSSVASSSASTRRTIVPLYNLQAHNVMTNVIVDAGTDAKIAKFQRRGIILIDLASLEPVEVWGDSPSSTGRHSLNLNVDEHQVGSTRNSAISSRSIAASSRAHTPEHHPTAASSVISLNSPRQSQFHSQHQNALHPQPRQHLPPLSDDASPSSISDTGTTPTQSTSRIQTTTPTRRNIFGKLFQNKKQSGLSSTPPASPSFAISPPPPQESTQTTPKAFSQPQESASATSSTNTNQKTEKSHMRNLSLTNFTSPLKTPFRNSKNKLPPGAAGSSSSSSLGVNTSPDRQVVGLGSTSTGQYVPSPNMSASSLAATSESMESGSAAHSASGHGNPIFRVTSQLQPPSHTPQPSTGSATGSAAPQTQLQQLQSRPPVLGIQPTYVSALGSNLSGPDDVRGKMRALMYVWLVRRWFKRSLHQDENEVSFASMATGGGGFLGLGSKNKDKDKNQNGNSAEPGAGVEVRVEWKRGKAKGSGRGRSGRGKSETESLRRRSTGTMTGEGGRARIDDEGGKTEREKSRDSRKKTEDKRLSKMSTKSNPSVGSGIGDAGSDEGAEGSRRRRSLKRPMSSLVGSDVVIEDTGRDEGEESDPEDSETPWVCTLKIRRTAPASAPKSSSRPKTAGEKEVLKLKVGTLSPTPHHPKVVAMLKVPFPLPDLEVERLSVRRRILKPMPGQGGTNEFGEVGQPTPNARDFAWEESGGDEYRGLLLTAEEIKDIVCSTALWLIVREGTGGVGRISRKGDGWKLRS